MKLAQAIEERLPIFTLKNIDDEELDDFLVDLQKSYGIKFGDQDLTHVNTYGELCDVIMHKLDDYEDTSDCTSQQAFYKLRTALGATFSIDQSAIRVDTKLEELIHRKNRISNVKRLRKNLGLNIYLLTPPSWYVFLIVVVSILSLIAFFFSWKIAVSGILLAIALGKIGSWFGKEFSNETVRELVQEMKNLHYRDSRRDRNTVNKAEMRKLLDEMIKERFDVDKAQLTRDAKFGWAK